MTIITGTADYQPLFQGLLSEISIVQGQPYGLQVVKLSGDSVATVTQLNSLIPSAYDYIDISYTGTNISQVVFKNAGVTVATLLLTYDASNNLKTVTRS